MPQIRHPFATAVAATVAFVLVAFAITSQAVAKPQAPADPNDFLVLAAPSQAYAAFDGIDGESAAVGHEREIVVHSVDWKVKRNGDARRGTIVPKDLSIAFEYEKAAPKLLEAAVKGKVFESVVVTYARPTGGGSQDYLRLELYDVIVTSYQTGSAGSAPVEQVGLTFEKMHVSYTVFGSDGQAKGTSEMTWDFTNGK